MYVNENLIEQQLIENNKSQKYVIKKVNFLENIEKNPLFLEMKASLEEYNNEIKNNIYMTALKFKILTLSQVSFKVWNL